MATKLSSRACAFDTREQAESYDHWFTEKVQEALNDARPGIPHEEAMAKLEAMLKEKRQLREAELRK